ncbi:mitogen-activated protein kinase kinase kinase 20-like [Drosophila sulfurigaster albostrigata]|uniref:mitogen-activated protein kinase kinase kinase 20-like n=1 Tax=Drosophila sulfurigaster albostrigata TaxID=89887 RepID=UPI002D21B9B1|nr:mitogen-activated protein kinase kinase kinase 20-like [Drosophila sulfurigaster albostrigata]
MAPELMDANGKYTEKCDVFSFGIIFWEVMSRKKPFEDLKDMHPLAIQKKVSEGVRPNVNDIMKFANSHLVKQSIEECWDEDPELRPRMKEVICDINVDSKNDIGLRFDDIELVEMESKCNHVEHLIMILYFNNRSDEAAIVTSTKLVGELSPTKCVAAKIIQDVISKIDIEKHILDLGGELKGLCHKNIVTFYDPQITVFGDLQVA